MQRRLETLGIPVQKVVRKRETGAYLADFYVPEMREAIPPAAVWARRLGDALPDIRIVDTHDTVANWRPGQPVIYATVAFHVEPPSQ
jgi:hypothetical protein